MLNARQIECKFNRVLGEVGGYDRIHNKSKK